jgi:AcrR family transcriptional regulator
LVERSTKAQVKELTKQEMSTDTREKILQAAFDVLSREGYENTSIKQIAEQAGVAQGLVHYYFKSKQRLVMEVLQFVCDKLELGVQGEAGAMAAFEDTKQRMREDRGSNALYVQLIGIALHDPEIGAGMRDFVRQQRGHVEDIARQVLAERELDPTLARGIAGAVWGGVLGIIIQSLIEPEFNADEAIDALAAMSLSAVFPTNQGA